MATPMNADSAPSTPAKPTPMQLANTAIEIHTGLTSAPRTYVSAVPGLVRGAGGTTARLRTRDISTAATTLVPPCFVDGARSCTVAGATSCLLGARYYK